MGWNDNNERNSDPWQRNRNKNSSNNGSGKGILDEFLKLLSGGGNSNDGDPVSKKFVLLIAVVVVGFVGLLGFYTVKEAEQAVVLRLGKFDRIEEPGLHWRLIGVDEVTKVDTKIVLSTKSSGSMLTKDENVVNVEMEVQYKITNPTNYLYNVETPDASLSQATDSALRYVIGHTLMDDVLTNGRERVRQDTRELLISIIEPYNMGISIVDVNFLPARAPDEVKAAFDDAIAAQEDEQRFKREAEAYKNEVLPKAEGQAKRLLEEAEAYKSATIAKAEGDIARFEKILPEYLAAPEITKRRIYLETMEAVYSNSGKVIVNMEGDKSPLLYLPLDKLANKNAK